MPNIFIVNLDKFNFGDQFYGGFDWGFEILRTGFELILAKISLTFGLTEFSSFQFFPTFKFQQIPIRGP